MNTPKQPKHAIVLSGGGADGAYEVGVLKALFAGKSPSTNYQPIDPDIFCGTSVGAFNAAFLVSRWDERGSAAITDLERVWIDEFPDASQNLDLGVYRFRLNPLEYFNPNSYIPNPFRAFARLVDDTAFLSWDGVQRLGSFIIEQQESLEERFVELFNLSSLIDRRPLENTIRRTIDFRNIRESSQILRIAATKWLRGELRIFKNSDMTDQLGPRAILASTSIPGFFSQTLVGAQPFVDGGVLMNAPLESAINAGGDILHIIYLSGDVKNTPVGQRENTMTMMLRSQVISWARDYNYDVESVRATNKKLAILERLIDEGKLNDDEAGELMTTVPTVRPEPRQFSSWRKLTVHRYYPRDNLSGVLGLLDFRRHTIEERIERGFNDATNYNPEDNQSVLIPSDNGVEDSTSQPPAD